MEEQELSSFQESLKKNFDKNKIGYCYQCGVYGRYVKSHSVQGSILKKMMNSGCVRVIQKWNLSFTIRLFNLKGSEVSTLIGPSDAGVFYLLCKGCEKSDNYENKLLNNLYTNFNQKDLKDIYLKSLYHALYNVRIKEGVIPLLNQSRKEDLDYAKEYLESEKKRVESAIKNHSTQRYIVLYNSIEHRGSSTKFNFSALINVPLDDENVTFFVLPDKYGSSRVIVIASDDEQSRRNKYVFNRTNRDFLLKMLVYDLFRTKTLGVVFYGDTDTTKVLKSFEKMDQISNMCQQINPLINVTELDTFKTFYNSLIRQE